jgi:hypothetical protein
VPSINPDSCRWKSRRPDLRGRVQILMQHGERDGEPLSAFEGGLDRGQIGRRELRVLELSPGGLEAFFTPGSKIGEHQRHGHFGLLRCPFAHRDRSDNVQHARRVALSVEPAAGNPGSRRGCTGSILIMQIED